MSKFTLNEKGFSRFMTSEEIVGREMRRRARLVRERAIRLAPEGRDRDQNDGFRYKESFQPIKTAIGRADFTPWGYRGRRIYAMVRNNSPHARFVEFGTDRTPRYRVLGQALEAAGDTYSKVRGVGRYEPGPPLTPKQTGPDLKSVRPSRQRKPRNQDQLPGAPRRRSAAHRNLMDEYYAWREAYLQEKERQAIGYLTEGREFDATHDVPTFQKFLKGRKRGGSR